MNTQDLWVDEANTEAVRRMAAAQPALVDIRLAGEVLPNFDGQVVLHAGPPIAYARMCPPMRSAVQAAVVYEGWAPDIAAANELLDSGGVELAPCHSRRAVGTMTGIITPSMPVFVVENEAEPRNQAFGRVTEGFGKGLRFGDQTLENQTRLRWVRDQLAPALRAAVSRSPDGRLPLRPLMANALSQGDELHMRNAASTALLVKALCVPLAEALHGQAVLPEVLRFLSQGNDQFFLDMLMAGAKVIADAGRGVPGSSVGGMHGAKRSTPERSAGSAHAAHPVGRPRARPDHLASGPIRGGLCAGRCPFLRTPVVWIGPRYRTQAIQSVRRQRWLEQRPGRRSKPRGLRGTGGDLQSCDVKRAVQLPGQALRVPAGWARVPRRATDQSAPCATAEYRPGPHLSGS